MPDDRVRATLTDIGTEEMAHWEMIATMIHQCMQGASMEELTAAGLDGYYILHNHGVFPADPNGIPFTSAYIACTGDPIADLVEDMAADAATSDTLHFGVLERYFRNSNEFQSIARMFWVPFCRCEYNQ